jgi:hypothetical protein
MTERRGQPPEQLDFFAEPPESPTPMNVVTPSFSEAKQGARGRLSLVVSQRPTTVLPHTEKTLLDAVLKQAAKLGW